MDDTITCFVKGPASRHPSWYIWLFPAWFVVLSGAAVVADELLTGGLPLWLAASEVGGLLIAGVTAVCVLLTAKRLAFRAGSHGILLGVRTNSKRLRMRSVFLPWPAVTQVCMVPRRSGIMVEIVLSPAAEPDPLPSRPGQPANLPGALLMPFGVGRRRPALTTPRFGPPRYRLTICEMSAAQLRHALRQVAPDTIPVRVFNSVAALRLLGPRTTSTGLLRPVWPAGSVASGPGGSLGPSPGARPPVAER